MAVHQHKLPPEIINRHRGNEGTRLTQGHTKPPGATANPAEPEPNPAGRGAEPHVYITHPTHGAGARPGKTQPPTANRKATQNADQCVRQPREVRGRNRQTPPPEKRKNNRRGRGARTAHSHHATHQHHNRPPNSPPRRHRRQDPPKGRQGTTQPKPATPSRGQWPTGRRDTKNTRTHSTLGQKKTQTANNTAGMKRIGAQRTRDPRPGQPATDTTEPPPQKKKQRGGGVTPYQRQHPRIAAPQAPPQEGRGLAGEHARPHAHPNNTSPRRGGAQRKPGPEHTRPHRTPEPGAPGSRRSAHTATHVRKPEPGQVGCGSKPKTNRKHRET